MIEFIKKHRSSKVLAYRKNHHEVGDVFIAEINPTFDEHNKNKLILSVSYLSPISSEEQHQIYDAKNSILSSFKSKDLYFTAEFKIVGHEDLAAVLEIQSLLRFKEPRARA